VKKEKLVELFEVPETKRFFYAITRSIFDVYQNTFKSIRKEFQSKKLDGLCPRGRDLFPHFRRALMDKFLIDISSASTKTTATTEKNKIGNCSHAEVKIGCFTVTASAVESPNEKVRQAYFRGTLAKSNQRDLFLPNEVSETDDYYGIIIHGNDKNTFHRPSFIRLAFPHIDYKGYFLNIDLIKYFDIDINKKDAKSDIKDNTNPRVRENKKKQSNTDQIQLLKSQKITRRNF
jgi:hypothetical protein